MRQRRQFKFVLGDAWLKGWYFWFMKATGEPVKNCVWEGTWKNNEAKCGGRQLFISCKKTLYVKQLEIPSKDYKKICLKLESFKK